MSLPISMDIISVFMLPNPNCFSLGFPGPGRHRSDRKCSLQNQELLRSHIVTCLQPIKVHTTCQATPIKPHIVSSSLFGFIDQRGHLLAESIEDGQRYVCPGWQSIANNGGGVEGVGVVLVSEEHPGANHALLHLVSATYFTTSIFFVAK